MAKISELIGLGLPGLVAQMMGAEKTSAAVGAGTTQADAVALSTAYTVFATAGASTGARLPNAAGMGPYMVVNGGANTLSVYPAVGEYINGGTINAAFSVTNAKTGLFFPVGNDWFAILSA